MGSKEISSQHHSLVKRAVRLRTSRKEREESREVLVSGRKLLTELASFCPLSILFHLGPKAPIAAAESIRVSPPVLKKICGHEEQDGLAAIVSLPPPQDLRQKKFILVLDGVSDPGNLGTLWRTALALGWEGVWLTPGTVDPFNDKALRAAKGATFRLPYACLSQKEIETWAKQRGATLWIADLDGESHNCHFKPPLALILGSEGHGPGVWEGSAATRITIPMERAVESLNVAAAGAILLYEMKRAAP